MGLDIGRFITTRTDYGSDVLPGLYWRTYFGPGAMAIVGERAFQHLRPNSVEKLSHGYLVRAYPSSSEAGTPTARRAEAEIMDQLGREHFFDKAQVNIESLKTDEVTAARVKRKIEQIKAARKYHPVDGGAWTRLKWRAPGRRSRGPALGRRLRAGISITQYRRAGAETTL
jgi:hypothetical protein